MVLQDNLSPKKHIDKIFGNTVMLLRNLLMAFYLLGKDMLRKIITTAIRPKLEYAEIIWSPHKKKHVEIGKNTENSNWDGARFERPNIQGKITIAIYKLLNNLEKTDTKGLIMKKKKLRIWGDKKISKKEFV